MHKSRLGTIIIDCETDNLPREAHFWAKALGKKAVERDDEGRYIRLEETSGEPLVILQKVEHPSWIHIDIESDNIEAEVKRLEKLGAVVVEAMPRWTIMEAPSKHRFCIIGPNRSDFDTGANVWE